MDVEYKTGESSLSFKKINTFSDFSTDYNYLATGRFLSALKKLADFKQIRFECKSSTTNRKIHIKTNSSMPSVIQFLIGESDKRPSACGSFTK